MARKSLDGLLKILLKELKIAQERQKKVKQSADEIARAAALSPSQSGDREHATGQAEIVTESLVRLRKLLDEIETSIKRKTPEEIGETCFVSLKYKNNDKQKMFLVKNLYLLPKVNLVSFNSDLGKALKGAKIGDKVKQKRFLNWQMDQPRQPQKKDC